MHISNDEREDGGGTARFILMIVGAVVLLVVLAGLTIYGISNTTGILDRLQSQTRAEVESNQNFGDPADPPDEDPVIDEGLQTEVPQEPEQIEQVDPIAEENVPPENADVPPQNNPAPVPANNEVHADPVPSAPASTTNGPGWSIPSSIPMPRFNDGAAAWGDGCGIDMSSASSAGYIAVRSSRPGNLKCQVTCGQMSYNYTLPNDNSPIYVPVNMGNGAYTVRVLMNTSGNNYVQLFSTSGNVGLASDRTPFIIPNMFVSYSPSSACVAKARELAAGCTNQGDVVRNIYSWMKDNISYDDGKAAWAATAKNYVPNPDATLAARSGICFDYASLAAAMFRSLGIPCKVMTGNVSLGNVYHAWNMIYINGEWQSVGISVFANSWNRIDITFAAGGATDFSSIKYSDRYTY